MKSTGIVRNIDELGRIVIPKEIRKILQFEENEPLEIFTDGDYIILQRYSPGCILCGEMENTKKMFNKQLCQGCIGELLSETSKKEDEEDQE